MYDIAKSFNQDILFKPKGKVDQWVAKLKHKPLKELIPTGFGIHNAGLLRKDRNIIEKLFLDGTLRVLVCTATLACKLTVIILKIYI